MSLRLKKKVAYFFKQMKLAKKAQIVSTTAFLKM